MQMLRKQRRRFRRSLMIVRIRTLKYYFLKHSFSVFQPGHGAHDQFLRLVYMGDI